MDTIITIIISFCETEIMIIDKKIWVTTGMQIRQFSNQNRQREMRNQQLSRPNQNYSQTSEVICNYCKKPGNVITNCNIRLNKQQS